MRTAKYHDYGVLKIALLFIVLVILGLFIYNQFIKQPDPHVADEDAWVIEKAATCTEDGSKYKVCTECDERFDYTVIPATGHNVLAPHKENEKGHTETKGECYESVGICTVCKEEVFRETVYVKHENVSEIIETHEKVVEPTCTKEGSYELVRTCKDCGFEISRETKVIEALGHDYEWEFLYINGVFMMKGTCDRDSSETVKTTGNGLKLTRDETVAPCCLVRYFGEVTDNGKTTVKTLEFEAEQAHLIKYSYESRPEYIDEYMALPEAKYDEEYGKYYDVADVPGILHYVSLENTYDDNGFAKGVYKCYTCEQTNCSECSAYYIVRIYNAEMDKRLNEDTES